jgi:hypothetical protein
MTAVVNPNLMDKLLLATEPLWREVIALAIGAAAAPTVDRVHRVPVSVTKPLVEATVTLWSSEVGAYLGKDSWSSRDKALGNVWRRANDAHFRCVQDVWRTAGCRFGQADTADTAARMRATFDPFPNVKTVEDVAAFRANASPDQVLKLYKSKGCLFEDEVAKLFGASIQQRVELRHTAVAWRSDLAAGVSADQRMCRPPGPITDPGLFTIVGEVDGWLLQPPYSNTIVEFKVRMQKIPALAPDRDILQIQTYMNINNVDHAIYVQNLFGTAELQVQSMKRDVHMWETEVLPGLREFVCDVRRLLRGDTGDKALQHRVLLAHETDQHPFLRSCPTVVLDPVASKPSTPPQPQPQPPMMKALPVAIMPPAPPQSPRVKSSNKRKVVTEAPKVIKPVTRSSARLKRARV